MRRFTRPLLFVLLGVLFAGTAGALPTNATNMIISGPHPEAVNAGIEIMEQGGNVVDVAVATALALTVTGPNYSSLGGGGFAVLKMKDTADVLDFRETAPALAHPDLFVKSGLSSTDGGLAVGVPGIPAGLVALHEKHGKLPWKRLFAPALRLSRSGFRVTRRWTEVVKEESPRFNDKAKSVFLKKGQFYQATELHRQPDLYKALVLYRNKKAAGFYSGDVAADVVHTVIKNKGILSLEDLKNYKVRWLKPIEKKVLGHKLYLMPPPSSGGVVLATALDLVERLKPQQYEPLGTDEFHMLAEILSRSFRSRLLLGDPDFHKNPIDQILSKNFIDGLEKSISLKKATSLPPIDEAKLQESTQTTHFSVMDKDGNALAMTITLNGNFGSGLASEKYGITLNNEMDDFTTKPGEPNMYGLMQGPGNKVEAGKRPLSSMSPTLVEKDGKVIMSVGAPGGPRIITAVFHTLYRSLSRGMNIDQAIQAARVHHQFLPNTVFYDPDRMSSDVVNGLKAKGHNVAPGWQGLAYGVFRGQDGHLEGAFDSRGEGAVGGR